MPIVLLKWCAAARAVPSTSALATLRRTPKGKFIRSSKLVGALEGIIPDEQVSNGYSGCQRIHEMYGTILWVYDASEHLGATGRQRWMWTVELGALKGSI